MVVKKKAKKRQTTIDESPVEVPESKKLKTEPEVAEKIDDSEPVAASRVEILAERKENEQNSSILQKGLIYFFYRPRVDLEKIDGPVDAQRSYIVLRPLPEGAQLKDQSKVEDMTTHFIELPKKEFPEKGDQFMAFVAQGNAKKDDLASRLGSSTYDTKTKGERTTPAARPMGEGVYCIADFDKATHLAYILTTPTELGPVQEAFNLQSKGSFVVSVKNPQSKSGGNQLPGDANFPDELQSEFGSRNWGQLRPAHLKYDGAGLLLIGQSEEAAKQVDEQVSEALTVLQKEDRSRESLKQIFIDLGLSTEEHESKPLIDGEFS